MQGESFRSNVPALRVMRRVLMALFLGALCLPGLTGCSLSGMPRGAATAPPITAPEPSAPATIPPLGPEHAEETATPDAILVPSFLGGPHRRTYGRGPVPGQLDLIWKARIGSGKTGGTKGEVVTWSGTGWTGQPTLVREAGHLYVLIGGYDHNLRKIDAETGETIWKYQFPDVIKGTNTVYAPPGAEGDPSRWVVVAGSRRGLGVSMGAASIAPVRAISYATGEEIWRLPVPRTRSYSQDADASPLYVNGRLYVAVESGYVYAIEPTGTVPFGEHSSPRIIARSPELYAASDTKKHGGNLVLESSPVVLGNRIYIAAGSGHVYGLDADTLEIVWDYFIGSDLDGTITATSQGRLLVPVEKQYIAGSGGLMCLDPAKPPAEALVWYYPTENRGVSDWLGGVIGSAAVNDEYDPDFSRPPIAAFNSVDGYLYVVSQDTVDGATSGPNLEPGVPQPVLVGRVKTGGAISTPLIVDDHIITAGYDGRVRILGLTFTPSAEETTSAGVLLKGRDGEWYDVSFDEKANFSGGGSFESTPLVWEGRIYIGSRDGNLYCIGLVE